MRRALIILPLLALGGCGDPRQDHLSADDIRRSEQAAAEEITANYAEDVNAVIAPPPVDARRDPLADIENELANAAAIETADGVEPISGTEARRGLDQRISVNTAAPRASADDRP